MKTTFKITKPHAPECGGIGWYFPNDWRGVPTVEQRDRAGRARGKREAGVWWQAALIDSPNTAPRFERYDPATCCDVCAKPEHRHGPHEDHPFESVNAATSRRNREDTKQPIRELITTTQEEA